MAERAERTALSVTQFGVGTREVHAVRSRNEAGPSHGAAPEEGSSDRHAQEHREAIRSEAPLGTHALHRPHHPRGKALARGVRRRPRVPDVCRLAFRARGNGHRRAHRLARGVPRHGTCASPAAFTPGIGQRASCDRASGALGGHQASLGATGREPDAGRAREARPVSQQQIAKLERSDENPTIATLAKVAAALQVRLEIDFAS